MPEQKKSAKGAPGAPRRPSAPAAPSAPPSTEVLLRRVVVVEGERSTALVAELAAAGIGARSVGAETLDTLIAGLIVFTDDDIEPDTLADVLRAHRRRQAAVAAIALSDAEDAGARLLNSVADVVLAAAAPAEVIAAQLRALARLLATDPPGAEPEVITVRGLTIDLELREARAGGRTLDLTPIEFRILAQLARRRGVVSHSEVFREVHGRDAGEREAKNQLKVHIWRLRAKLAQVLPGTAVIVNVRGFGYLLERRTGREARRRG